MCNLRGVQSDQGAIRQGRLYIDPVAIPIVHDLECLAVMQHLLTGSVCKPVIKLNGMTKSWIEQEPVDTVTPESGACRRSVLCVTPDIKFCSYACSSKLTPTPDAKICDSLPTSCGHYGISYNVTVYYTVFLAHLQNEAAVIFERKPRALCSFASGWR